MIKPLIAKTEPITVVGGAPTSVDDVAEALQFGATCVAADGGADLALKAGVTPQLVIGDFDSITAKAEALLPPGRLHRVAEQSTTDFEKALSRVETPLVVAVGCLGGRVDHELAAFHSLLVFAHQPCILLGQNEIVFLAPPELSFDAIDGDIVSLFPLGHCTGKSTGLNWPIEGLKFAPGQQVGTSNHALGPVTLAFAEPTMLVILPRHFLSAIVTCLKAPECVQWPARVRSHRDPIGQ